MRLFRCISVPVLLLAFTSCADRPESDKPDGVLYRTDTSGTRCRIWTYHPDGSIQDSISLPRNLNRIICMSSSHVACLSAIGCDSLICGVSGIKYISDSLILRRFAEGTVADVGSDVAPDYEKILSMSPDLVTAYSLPGSDFVKKLRALGVNVLVLNDYLENNPLGRASYIKLFGALTGKTDEADSVFERVRANYDSLSAIVEKAVNQTNSRKKVLVNVPYSDVWFIPGGDNYMSRLIRDAGGEVLGAVEGNTESGTISVEQAYLLSKDAQVWLNTGWFDTLDALYASASVFGKFGCADNVYNNTLRTTPGGGNDFWESGAVRPDLILSDLTRILYPGLIQDAPLHYYRKLVFRDSACVVENTYNN